jgi:hypothetical protein
MKFRRAFARCVCAALGTALPAPALAQADCTVHRACWDQACEAMDLPMSLQPSGEGWELAWQQGAMVLYQGAPDDPEGTLALYEPYENGRTSVFTLYASGEMVLTSHQRRDGVVLVATFYGNCAGDGG